MLAVLPWGLYLVALRVEGGQPFEYRPLLSNNVIMRAGASTLIPGTGFKDLFNKSIDSVNPLVAAFMELILAF